MSADGEKDKSIENMEKEKAAPTTASAAVDDIASATEGPPVTTVATNLTEDEIQFEKKSSTNSLTEGKKADTEDSVPVDKQKPEKTIGEDSQTSASPNEVKLSYSNKTIDEDKDVTDDKVKEDDEEETIEESEEEARAPQKETKKDTKKDSKKPDAKEENGTDNASTDKKKPKDDKPENDEADENNEEGTSLADFPKIFDNINKTRVDGLQTLYTICFGAQGKNNVVKKNLRSFSGFKFDEESNDYKKKVDSIKKIDTKSLKSICDVLVLDRKGSKEDISDRILKFLLEPNESALIKEPVEDEEEDDDEEEDEEDAGEEEEEEEEISEEEDKRKRKRPNQRGAKNSTGRPRRATAGKKMSAYVDFSSSEESVHKAPVSKRRRRNDDSESGSDYNPSGNSDSDGGRKRQSTRSTGRGRAGTRKGRRRGSDSEEESELSEQDSDVAPKRKRSAPIAKPSRGRITGRSSRRGTIKKRNDSESEDDVTEEELSDLGSDRSEEDSKKKKPKKSLAPAAQSVKNSKTNNKAKTPVKPAAKGRKSKKDSSGEEDDKDESEDEPLTKKGKPSFPTDEQIKSYVKEILDKANLEEITMKTVCKQVYAKYPDFDLTEKKDFIKSTVKALIAA